MIPGDFFGSFPSQAHGHARLDRTRFMIESDRGPGTRRELKKYAVPDCPVFVGSAGHSSSRAGCRVEALGCEPQERANHPPPTIHAVSPLPCISSVRTTRTGPGPVDATTTTSRSTVRVELELQCPREPGERAGTTVCRSKPDNRMPSGSSGCRDRSASAGSEPDRKRRFVQRQHRARIGNVHAAFASEAELVY